MSVVPAAAAVVAVLAACGGGSEDLGEATARVEPVSLSAWSSQLERGCAELEDRHGDLTSVELESAGDARDHADDVAAFSGEYAELVESAGVPARRPEAAERLLATAERLADAGRDLADAADDGDAPAAGRAAERLRSLGERLDELTGDLDIDGCGGFAPG